MTISQVATALVGAPVAAVVVAKGAQTATAILRQRQSTGASLDEHFHEPQRQQKQTPVVAGVLEPSR